MVNKKLALLGATGSIGSSTLEVAMEQQIPITLASAHRDYPKLLEAAIKHKIACVSLTGVSEPSLQARLRRENPQLRIYYGESELLKALQEEDYDIALNAITGSAGLRSTFAILNRGKTLALANKESLVMAGHLVREYTSDSPIIPVDSEHSAIFQAIGAHPASEIRKLHITASGGAFRELPLQDFNKITPAEALKHPNWSMGAKVTLDSATMFNKALEVIEAHWLFGLPYTQIEAIIHPQSVIHSLVEFIDGSFLAQMSVPDMKLPILYALSWPSRVPSALVKTSLLELPELSFQAIESQRYPLFYLGLEAAKTGGIHPTVMNAAVEAASSLFLKGLIRFTDIPGIVRKALDWQTPLTFPDLDTIIEVNLRVFQKVFSQSL